jgi:hypothetical protein
MPENPPLNSSQASSVQLIRKITFTETFASDGVRKIECISESFLSPQEMPLESEDGLRIARLVLGHGREREQLPQADPLGRYPCPGTIGDIFRCWPERDNETLR